MEQPQYKHDCEICRYAGTFDNKDVYACYACDAATAAFNTVMLLRFGDEGHEYESMSYGGLDSIINQAADAARVGLNVGSDTWSIIAKWSEVRAMCSVACSSEVR